MRYNATLTSGGLLLRESRIIAALLLANPQTSDLLSAVRDGNLLQKRSPETSKKIARIVISRLTGLQQEYLEIIRDGGRQEVALLLLAVLVDHAQQCLLGDFLLYIERECRSVFKKELTTQDWTTFFTQCAQIQPALQTWKPTTVAKLRATIFTMLAECGSLDSSRTKKFSPVFFPPTVRKYLAECALLYTRACMEGLQ